MMRRLRMLAAGAVLATTALSGAGAATTVGTPTGSGNVFPFALFGVGGWYQEEFAAAAFNGTTAFDTLTYKATTGGTASVQGGTFTIDFYYTASPLGLSTDKVGNRGNVIGSFGSFTDATGKADTLSLTGTLTTYDPTRGNLLMELNWLAVGTPNAFSGYQAVDDFQTDVARAYQQNPGTAAAAERPGALVTTFSTTAAVPEPATWAMFVGGFGLVALGLRRRSVGVRFA